MGAEAEHRHDLETLAALLDRLPERDGWLAEVGAWDGEFLSASRDLIVDRGYRAVLIEADAKKYGRLRGLYRNSSTVQAVHARVGWDGADSLDTILLGTGISSGFDLLVIDIDGNDYHVWDALCAYKPKLVMVEFNPTIPTGLDFVQPRDHRVSQGSSLTALVRLAVGKGYTLVGCGSANAIFMDEAVAAAAGIESGSVKTLGPDSAPAYLFQGFDGTVFVHGSQRLPWHDVPFSQRRLQQLPRLLRRHPDSYGPVTWRLLLLLRWWRRAATGS